MRGWVLTATMAIAIAGAAVGLLALGPRARPAPPPPASAAACPPDAPLPEGRPATAGVALEAAAAAQARLDGKPLTGPARLPAGRHLLEAAGGVRLELELPPFSPVTLQLLPDGEAWLPVVLGARCLSCEPPPAADLDLSPLPPPAPLDDSARALARGGWRTALEALRRVPPAERARGRARAQAASAWSLRGRPSQAPALAPALEALERRRPAEAEAERAWQVERWNLATERLSALLTAFAPDAERLVSAASVRTEQLSAAFGTAAERHDLPGGLAALEAEEATLEALRKDLLALKPADCTWRARVATVASGP